jgi:hypothetical protein
MKRPTPGVFFLLLVAAGFTTWLLLKSNPHKNALRVREVATWGLAEHLARVQPGKRALIVSNPFTERSGTAKEIAETEQAGIRGLRAGFGTRIASASVVFPELKPGALEDPRALLGEVETSTPLSYLMIADAFDKLARQHADCEIIVSLIGLPAEIQQGEVWNTPGKPIFALLLPDLTMVGDFSAVQNAVKSGKLAAFVLPKPGAPQDDANLSSDLRLEFARRFVLVTAENVDQMMQTYPTLF